MTYYYYYNHMVHKIRKNTPITRTAQNYDTRQAIEQQEETEIKSGKDEPSVGINL